MASATINLAPLAPSRLYPAAAAPVRILSDRPLFPPSKSLEPAPRFAGNTRHIEDRAFAELGEIGDIVLPKTPRSLAAGLALAAGIAAAQTTAPPAGSQPSFEAVAIKPNTSGSQSTSSHGSQGQVLMQNMSLRQLLERALGVKSYQLTGPAWMDNTRFDIAAKYPIGATADERSHMLKPLLEQRFGLVLHDETHEMPGYALVVGKSGIKAKPEQTADGIDSQGNGKTVHLKAKGVSMADLAAYLNRRLNLIVVDKTEATGLFNFEMQWDLQQDNLKVTDLDPGTSIFNELQDKVGVKLQAAKVPVQVFVVDKLERTPSEN